MVTPGLVMMTSAAESTLSLFLASLALLIQLPTSQLDSHSVLVEFFNSLCTQVMSFSITFSS